MCTPGRNITTSKRPTPHHLLDQAPSNKAVQVSDAPNLGENKTEDGNKITKPLMEQLIVVAHSIICFVLF